MKILISCYWFLSMPPENVRKPSVSCFQGVLEEHSGMKWVNSIVSSYSYEIFPLKGNAGPMFCRVALLYFEKWYEGLLSHCMLLCSNIGLLFMCYTALIMMYSVLSYQNLAERIRNLEQQQNCSKVIIKTSNVLGLCAAVSFADFVQKFAWCVLCKCYFPVYSVTK